MAVSDAAIARLAGQQHGIVAVWQLRDLGIGERVILRRAADGRLHRLYQGVYAVGHSELRREGRWLAAVLAYGPQAVLSHRSAAALWGIRETSRAAIDLSLPSSHPGSRPGIDAHATAALHPDDLTVLEGIPVTSRARTPSTSLTSCTRSRCSVPTRGRRSCARWIQRRSASCSAAPTGAAGEGGPANASRERARKGFLVDAYWPDARLVVELQGYAHHSDPMTFATSTPASSSPAASLCR